MRPGPRQDVRTPPLFLSFSNPKAHEAHEAQTPQPIEQMTTTPTELRPIASHAIIALAGLMPFTHGSGHDSHGNPVPYGERVVTAALRRLVQAGQDAKRILDQTQPEEAAR